MSELHYTDEEKIRRLSAWHESEKAEIIQLRSEVARLTAGSEAMQEDARNNTATINKLKDALTRISHTSVTLGNSQSAWEAWRICATIANEALK